MRASENLPVEVAGDRLRELVEQQVHGVRVVVKHGLGFAEVFGGAAFNHIGGQCPWATRETNQRHAAIQGRANGAHGVHHVAKVFFRIRDWQGFNVGQAADDFLETRAFAGFKVQALAHGVGNGEDVGEQDGRIQLWVAVQRLQGDFGFASGP